MVKHIVMWDVSGEPGEDALAAAGRLRKALLALRETIPSLGKLEVGIQDDDVPRMVLYSEFADREALDAYRMHPDHQAVIPVLRAATRKVGYVDYEA
jgi:quinol monooxygenase YgiN